MAKKQNGNMTILSCIILGFLERYKELPRSLRDSSVSHHLLAERLRISKNRSDILPNTAFQLICYMEKHFPWIYDYIDMEARKYPHIVDIYGPVKDTREIDIIISEVKNYRAPAKEGYTI